METSDGLDVAMFAFSGVIDAKSVRALQEHVESAGSRQVVICIESPGGILREALKCADWLEMLQRDGKIITAVAVGAVGSAAIAIFAACERRATVPEASFLFHRTEVVLDDLRGIRLTASSLGNISSKLGKMDKEFMKIISRAARQGTSYSWIRDLMDNEETVSAQWALSLGLAQEIVSLFDLPKSGV